VTGTLPARSEQVRTLDASLRLLEVASLCAVLLIMALAFRSLAAPLLTLVTGGLSFVLVTRVAGLISARQGWNIPTDLEPVMVALTFGITTDYVAYFLTLLGIVLLFVFARFVPIHYRSEDPYAARAAGPAELEVEPAHHGVSVEGRGHIDDRGSPATDRASPWAPPDHTPHDGIEIVRKGDGRMLDDPEPPR